ncbi:LD-carboxypeptidase [Actinoplanes sp. N902-109]|uniref:S66 peptidase family protein n=1 Tax=Actinoplanes sp. (strain N902-109) TaxID=649831 RepID=UPI0003295DBB|nr:S66 peptidase family protein [Actinoplanes sp. N902-109]AGL19162.1 microcin C7 immunity protein [Actinoplanes sp. N902-109]
MTRTLPTALRPGHRIGLWTPSAPAPALFPRRYERARAALAGTGFEITEAPGTRGNTGVGAADPRQLADDLHGLLTDDRVDAVMATTGGYTSLAVLPYIDWDLVRRARRPIIGYSDITAVLWATFARAGLVSFHGPMLVSEWGEWGGPWPYTIENFLRLLGGGAPVAFTPPPAWTDESLYWDVADDRRRISTAATSWRCLRPGSAEGWLLPGCAPTASQLFGTPYLPEVDGAILCLEFPAMGPDQVWGYLLQWAQSGCLDRVAGLVIGRQCLPGTAAGGSGDYAAVIDAAVGDRRLPVLLDVDFGHTEPRITLPVGVRARLDADAGTLTLLEGSTA